MYAIRTLYFGLRGFYRLLFMTVFPCKAYNKAVFKKVKPPYILAGNHEGLLDGPMLILTCPRMVNFMVDEGVKNWPIVGKVMPWMPVVFIDQQRPKTALKRSADALKKGKILCIFPEGELTKDGNLQDFNAGVILIQSLCPDVPIIPFAIDGGHEAWPYGWRPHPGPVSIRFGEPIVYNPEQPKDAAIASLKATVQALLNHGASA